jgi:DNA primase
MSQLVIPLLDKVLNSKGRSLHKQNEYMWWSPFVQHHKPKLQVNIETGKWHCWVSNQGGHNLFQLLKQVGADRSLFKELSEIVGSTFYSSERKKEDIKVLLLPKEMKYFDERDSVFKRHALRFLYSRGITDIDIIRYSMGYCTEGIYQNRIIVPSYDSDGKLNYFIGRDFYKGGMKYKNPSISKDIIGFDLYVNWNEPIILCEGVFDAIAIKNNSIPLFGKTILPKLYKKIIEKQVRHIVISLDDDAFKDSLQMTNQFMDMGINVSFVKLKGKDPSEIGYENMVTELFNSQRVDFKELMRMKLYGNK